MIVKQRNVWRFRWRWFIWKLRTRIQYWLTGDCGNGCGWAEPYGFVPEAECPIHDKYPMAEGGQV